MFTDAEKMLSRAKLDELGEVMQELKSSLTRELKAQRQMEH
jgi:hypothetical protein